MYTDSWKTLCELKGYVDACIDANQEGDGVPFSMLETIQKRIDSIVDFEIRKAGRIHDERMQPLW